MADLFDKLNTLMRARVRGALGGGGGERRPAGRGKDLDREVAALRAQIDRALDDEDAQQTAIDALRRQIEEGDLQADRALQAGDEATARHLIRQLQRDRQRLTMLEADLGAHRRSASELIREVNALEATIAEARRTRAPAVQPGPLSQELGSRLSSLREDAAARFRREAPPPAEEVDERAVEDDLAARRARLSQ